MTLSPNKRLHGLLAASCLLCAATQATAATPPAGETRTAVILVNFSDKATQPVTPTFAHNLVFGAVSDFFWEASYQSVFLSGDTFGWFTIPVTASTCDRTRIAAEGKRAATAAGANLAAYSHVVYMFPANSGCTWSGVAGTGSDGERHVFVNGSFSSYVVAHELGHTFGLLHSDGLDCDTGPLGATCAQRSAGDGADVMGARLAHPNAFQKEQLGWLGGSGKPALTTVTGSGRHVVEPMSSAPAGGAKALKVLKSIDPATGFKTWYYVEYRQPTGFDAGLASVGNLAGGVLVHTGVLGASGYPTSLLLDMTPGSDATSSTGDLRDAALAAGRVFNDPASGVSITLVSASASGAVVDVAVSGQAPAPNDPPPSDPAPAPLTTAVGTDKPAYARGETVTISALVKREGVAAAGAQVRFTVGKAGGAQAVLDATSGSDGHARVQYRLGKAKAASGSYGIAVESSLGASRATASAGFSVQ